MIGENIPVRITAFTLMKERIGFTHWVGKVLYVITKSSTQGPFKEKDVEVL